MREYTTQDYLKEQLKDPVFRERHELEMQKMDVVQTIVGYRIRHGLTQKAFAAQVGVSQQHISKIEQAEFSNMATLEKVLRAIGYAIKITAVPVAGKRTAAKSRAKKTKV